MTFQEHLDRIVDLLGGSACRGATAAEISAAETRLTTRFPEEVWMLLSTFNGSDDATPVENGWVRFWPTKAWRRVAEEPDTGPAALPDAVLFADHSLVCWWYAIDIEPGAPAASVYLVDGVGPARRVAESLSGFLHAIIHDDEALYGGRRL